MARSQAEIADRVEERLKIPLLGQFSFEVLAAYLDYDHVSQFLKDEPKPEDWPEPQDPSDLSSVQSEAVDYLRDYGFPKAINHRGISASRSVQKLEDWLWLLGEDEVLVEIDSTPYPQYGAPKLVVVADTLEVTIPDDERFVRMANGEPCKPECMEGCGW